MSYRRQFHMLKIIIIALVVTVVGIYALSVVEQSQKDMASVVEIYSEEDDSTSKVKVTIEGEVIHEGTYSISPQESLSDLIDLAGGTTENADTTAYTPGLEIGTRTAFYIPAISDEEQSCKATVTSKVNINEADEEALKAVGFSSSQAENLISYREANGDFEAIEDIMEVSGIGDRTFAKVKDYITIS